jgi:hypothetical protein
MQRFGAAKKIIIIDTEHPMCGQAGIMARLRSDGGAWIDMNDEPPKELTYFPEGDHRHKHILLYPEQCAVQD